MPLSLMISDVVSGLGAVVTTGGRVMGVVMMGAAVDSGDEVSAGPDVEESAGVSCGIVSLPV